MSGLCLRKKLQAGFKSVGKKLSKPMKEGKLFIKSKLQSMLHCVSSQVEGGNGFEDVHGVRDFYLDMLLRDQSEMIENPPDEVFDENGVVLQIWYLRTPPMQEFDQEFPHTCASDA